jgi:transcriptional regulator NrdR family protein
MTCPVCGKNTKVYDSRAEEDSVRRRRVCLSCRYVFTTIELDEDLFERIKDVKSTQNSHSFARAVEDNH